MKTNRTIPVLVAFAGLLAIVMLAMPVSVSAANPAQSGNPPVIEETPPPPGSPAGEEGGQGHIRKALERIYAREQEWLAGQEARLNKSDEANARVNALIEKAREKGLDPAPLEAALEEFNSQIADARREHLKARAILSIHAGFNDQGKVIHLDEAHETVRTAGEALRSARRTMVDAARDLFQALRDFREQ